MMMAMVDHSPIKGCVNPDSYGEICIRCNKCGRYITMTDKDIKGIIEHILDEYINHDTRRNYDVEVQKNTIMVNKGLTKACEIIINDFGHDTDALVKYAEDKLTEVIKSGVQSAHVHDPGDIDE